MNVLILGATGAMGSHLVNILAEQQHLITATSRKVHADQSRIHWCQGNAKDPAFITKLLQKRWDAIVDFMIYTMEDFTKICPLFLNASGQYVFLSSSRVYADAHHPLTENDPRLLDVTQDKKYLSTREYALEKARQEDFLRGQPQKNWTIVRPYITYAENRLQLGTLEKENWLQRALNGKAIVFSKDILHKKTTLTYGRDVARGIAALLNQPSALGETFHITSSQSISWEEVLECYLNILEKHLGKRPPVILTEKSVTLAQDFKPFSSPIYQLIYDRYYNRLFNTEKINHYIPISSFMSPLKGLEKALSSFLQHPCFLKGHYGVTEAFEDYVAHEHLSWTEFKRHPKKFKYLLARYFLAPWRIKK